MVSDMKRTVRAAVLLAVGGSLLVAAGDAEAQRRRRRPANEVVAWSADGTVVVFAERTSTRSRDSRQTTDVVARSVPDGEVIARRRVFPGPCARLIERRVAVSHACALARLRPELPRRYEGLLFHVAANERSRIQRISLRADGSVVERELPTLGVVLRGRTTVDEDERSVGILEVSPVGRSATRTLDRRPMRPRARRHWILLLAGDDHVIVVGAGVLRRIGRPRPRPERSPGSPPSGESATGRPASG
jgi:hypothetical protein